MPFPELAVFPSKGLYPNAGEAAQPVTPNPARKVPKLKVPLQLGTTGLATVEQDSLEDVAACVYALLATERGSRLEETDYGVEEVVFDGFPPELDEWLVQIGIWEPRAEVRTRAEIEGLFVTLGIEVAVRG